MRLNRATDTALRVLMLLAKVPAPMSVVALAARLDVPHSNAMKIIARLSAAGFVETQRGRGGGVTIGMPAEAITVGRIVALFETDMAVVECLGDGDVTCPFLPRCALKRAMSAATEAFIASLDGYSLADIAGRSQLPRALVTG